MKTKHLKCADCSEVLAVLHVTAQNKPTQSYKGCLCDDCAEARFVKRVLKK